MIKHTVYDIANSLTLSQLQKLIPEIISEPPIRIFLDKDDFRDRYAFFGVYNDGEEDFEKRLTPWKREWVFLKWLEFYLEGDGKFSRQAHLERYME